MTGLLQRGPAARSRRRKASIVPGCGHESLALPEIDTVLIFDTETTTDFRQSLRVGGWIIKSLSRNRIIDAGLFYGDLSDAELTTLQSYQTGFNERLVDLIDAAGNPAEYEPIARYHVETPLRVIDRAAFCDLLIRHLLSGGAVAGHNLPFDLGAIAYAWRGWSSRHDDESKGFVLHLCECAKRVTKRVIENGAADDWHSCPDHPAIITRRLAGKKIAYSMADGTTHGPMIDTVILGRALLGPGALSLRKLGERFRCAILKIEGDQDHGVDLRPEYLDYLIGDVHASLDLFEHQVSEYRKHNLSAPLPTLYSEASVGKAYFSELGIRGNYRQREYRDVGTGTRIEWRDVSAIFAASQSAYRGARSEVMRRLAPTPIAYCDFKSQYPSVNALMRLQSLVTAESYFVDQGDDARDRAQQILDQITIAHLQNVDTWPLLTMIIRIRPQDDILPAKWKAKTEGKLGVIYGMAKIKSGPEIWITLADAVASKLLTGHVPHVIAAIHITPNRHAETRTLDLFGRRGSRIDLRRDDLFTRIIEERTEVRRGMKSLNKGTPAYEAADAYQNALKLISNSTAYGIFAETLKGAGSDIEGSYFAPFIAAHITGASRLLLAIAETLAHDIGVAEIGEPIRYVMCDTDSMAFARPASVSREIFDKMISQITGWFERLSPYRNDRNLFARDHGEFDKPELMFFGVSCKRYCLYRRQGDKLELIKVSSHGTGCYSFDRHIRTRDDDPEIYEDDEIEAEAEHVEITSSPKWGEWRNRLWQRAIERAEGMRQPHGAECELPAGVPDEAWSKELVRYRTTIATPSYLSRFSRLDVRPYSFILTFSNPGDGSTPYASYYADTERAIIKAGAWNVKTGEKLIGDNLYAASRRMSDALSRYFVNPERKAVPEDEGKIDRPSLAIGWMRRHEIVFDEIEAITRTGQRQMAFDFEEV